MDHEQQNRFFISLNAEQKNELLMAMKYYEDILSPPSKGER